MKNKYNKPKVRALNPQDLIDKERSFSKLIRSGMLQILALTSRKDPLSQEQLRSLKKNVLSAIEILFNIYEIELENVPVDKIIVTNNIKIITKIKSLFVQGKYEDAIESLDKLQS